MSEKKVTCIRDIYSGKPDARDEKMLSNENFLGAYVMPPNFDLDGLLREDKFLISGYKGTGKTALLLYLEEQFKKIDETSCTSFVLFKSDFDNRKRDEWAKTMTVKREGFLTQPDFSAMWRWHLFQQMVEDNEKHNGRIFVEDSAWDAFAKLVTAMVPQKEWQEQKAARKKGLGGGKIAFGLPLLGGLVSPEMEVTLELSKDKKETRNFYDLIDETTAAFCHLARTEVPYYIFLDELEAFYGDSEIFHRDLRLLRDLILEAKALNMLMRQLGMDKTKIICAVRSEIINSINRFIESKEVNKVVDGFDCPLIWDYNTNNSFKHPIMEILIKRIEMSERSNGVEYAGREELLKKWFPERIDTTDPVSFILNNNWSKPRDIVRLIKCAQKSLHFEDTAFTQAVLESSMPSYSRESLTELREELRALYSAQEIDDIMICFTGFVDTFTLEELRKRVENYYPNSVLADRTLDVLSDLYRLGIIGNVNTGGNRYRWHYRGEDRIILNDEWMITIHSGLRKALSTTRYKKKKAVPADPETHTRPFGQGANPKLVGSVVTLSDIGSSPNGIKGWFDGNTGTVSRRRLGDLPPMLFYGGTLQVRVLGLNPLGGSYELEPVDEVPVPSGEVLLTNLKRSTNGGVRGVFGTPAWQGVGTISASRWKALECPHALSEIHLKGRIVGRNAVGDSYALEPTENPVVLVCSEETKEQLPPPDMDAVYELQVVSRNMNGGIRGTFGECGWVGTVSKLRLEEREMTEVEAGAVLRVRVDQKNPLGESYALLLAESN